MHAAEVEHLNAVDKYPNIVVTGEVEGDILLIVILVNKIAGVGHIEVHVEFYTVAHVLVNGVAAAAEREEADLLTACLRFFKAGGKAVIGACALNNKCLIR